MKKTLIALALTALPVAAMADVTLYGQIKGGLEYTKVNGVGNTVTNINDWGSKIGFKGEEDLGNGLKAIWQIEQSVSLDKNSAKNTRWANKTSFIGLDTPFGKVRAGNVPDSIDDLYAVDPWSGNNFSTLSVFNRNGDHHRGVRYDTPDIAGFSANVMYAPEDNTRYDQARPTTGDIGNFASVAGVVNTITANKTAFSVGLNYSNSGFFAQYGFKNVKNGVGGETDKDGNVAPSKNAQAHLLEVGYDANNLFVGLAFQVNKGFDTYKDLALTGAYTMGNITPRLSYAHGFDDNKYDHIVLGADYAFSKRTTALFSIGYYKESSFKATTAGLGLSHKF